MRKVLVLIFCLITLTTYSQTKYKFITYKLVSETDYSKRTYCGSYKHRRTIYGTRRTKTACLLNMSTKKMVYVTKVISCKNYCNLSTQYFIVDWIQYGYRDDWEEGKIYKLELKK